MASTRQATSKKVSPTSVASFLLFITKLVFLGILLVVTAILLLLGTLVGMVILFLLMGSLLLVFKCCRALVLPLFRASYEGATTAYTKAQASRRYQTLIKPWLIALLKRFFRWFIPLYVNIKASPLDTGLEQAVHLL